MKKLVYSFLAVLVASMVFVSCNDGDSIPAPEGPIEYEAYPYACKLVGAVKVKSGDIHFPQKSIHRQDSVWRDQIIEIMDTNFRFYLDTNFRFYLDDNAVLHINNAPEGAVKEIIAKVWNDVVTHLKKQDVNGYVKMFGCETEGGDNALTPCMDMLYSQTFGTFVQSGSGIILSSYANSIEVRNADGQSAKILNSNDEVICEWTIRGDDVIVNFFCYGPDTYTLIVADKSMKITIE